MTGIDFVDTSHLYSDRATRLERLPLWALWLVPEGAQSAWTLQETHCNSTIYEPLNVCLTNRRLNQLS